MARIGGGRALFSITNQRRHGFALLPPAGEVPFIGEGSTLARFHGLEAAVISLQPCTGMILPFQKREAAAVGTHASMLLDEGVLGHSHIRGDACDFVLL